MKFAIKNMAKQIIRGSVIAIVILPVTILFNNNEVHAEKTTHSLIPPTDPTQSITYWKKYALDDENELVQIAQQVFNVLLRAWDQSRIEPALYVLESESGAWAASLSDGNILLSKQAIETSFSFGRQRGEHLLAFVLAHELAHQRADDLWHQRFFRMIGTQSVESQKKMLSGLELDAEQLTQMEQKEAQADHDGLIMMASVGFDAHQIIKDKDFYTLWVENIWQYNCRDMQTQNNNYNACKQAQVRALRTKAQLETVATQSLLYDLGVQEFVAGNYSLARDYFTSYGRDYPGRAIISAIGLSYFAQAQSAHKRLNELQASVAIKPQTTFYYPMILDANVNTIDVEPLATSKRSDTQSKIIVLQKQKTVLLNKSISQFEKALRLAPDYRQTYLLLASAHLLANNSYRVRGVLQGQYLPQFGKDPAVAMLLALTIAIEGDTAQSIKQLQNLINDSKENKTALPIPENIFHYSVSFNLAALYRSMGKTAEAKKVWLALAQKSKTKGDTMLFRLALLQTGQNKGKILTQNLRRAPAINGKRLGDKINLSANTNKSELWIDGEPYQVLNNNGSRYIVQSDGSLISAWQKQHKTTVSKINNKLKIGDLADRPFKILGIPDRRLNMTSGEYLAYDNYGLAVRISNNQVKGWFLYDKH
jgi:hypothetical protein